MTSKARSWIKSHEPKRFCSGCRNHFVHINTHGFVDHLKFVDKSNVDTPKDIFQKLRGFGGTAGRNPMNFVDGTIGDGKFTATQENVTVSIDGVTESGAATLAIRPEDIEIRGSDQPGIDAKVYEVEPLGAFTIVDIIIGEKILKVQVAGQPEFELGSAVRLFLDPLNCHLFDGASGDIIAHAKQ